MTPRQYSNWYYKNHNKYERKAFGIVKKRIEKLLVKINYRSLTPTNYKKAITKEVKEDDFLKMLNELYLTIGIIHGNRIYQGIANDNLNIKAARPMFNEAFQELLLIWLRRNAGTKIKTIRKSFINTLIDFIANESDEGISINKIVSSIIKTFGNKKGLYRSQIMRIVRTETAAAANYAALQAMESENLIIDKVWISTHDNRTRDGDSRNEYDHLAMHGVTKPREELFKVPNQNGDFDSILFPADPTGEPGNVINCRCTIAPKPRRNEQGFLILKL